MTERTFPEPIGQAIPIPTVRTESFAWHKRDWPSAPELPAMPPRIAPLSVVTNLFYGAYLIFVSASIVALALQLADQPDSDPVDTNLLRFALVAASVSGLALLLRRLGIAAGLSRVMFIAFSCAAIFVLALATNYVIIMPSTTMEESNLITSLSNGQVYGVAVAGTVLANVVWSLVNAEMRTYEQLREAVQRAMTRVMPGGQWERITGRPGGVLSADAGTVERRTAIAEQLTAPLLSELLRMPGVSIVHRIQFPGSATAHIGHAVISGSRIALIDSVLWEPGDYRLDRWGRILRNGAIDESITIALPIAAERFTAAVPNVPIEPWVVAHRLSDGPLTAVSDDGAQVHIVTPDALLREVGDWLSAEGDQVNVFANEFVLRHRLG